MEKDYIELSVSEKTELAEFCSSEAEYNQLKEVFVEAEMMQFETLTPKKETKKSLDSLFDETYPKVAPIWYMSVLATVVPKEKALHRQPLMQIAAVGLLFLLMFPFFNSSEVDRPSQVAEVQQEEPSAKKEPRSAAPIANKLSQEIVVDDVTDEVIDDPVVIASVTPTDTRGAAIGSASSIPGPDHSDGVFAGVNDLALSQPAFSQPASSQPEMLDLLTATF